MIFFGGKFLQFFELKKYDFNIYIGFLWKKSPCLVRFLEWQEVKILIDSLKKITLVYSQIWLNLLLDDYQSV